MLHVVKLIERRFSDAPQRGSRVLVVLMVAMAVALAAGIVLAVRQGAFAGLG